MRGIRLSARVVRLTELEESTAGTASPLAEMKHRNAGQLK